MSKIIPKKPALVYNSIEHQSKVAANSLTIEEWNRVVNILKQQANLNTKYLEDLHRMLFYDWNSDDSGFAVGEILPVFYEYPEGLNILTILQGKVDKVPGMGLSKNDFTDEYKNKVDSVVDGVLQLQTVKQGKLTAGENITIDENNVISSSGIEFVISDESPDKANTIWLDTNPDLEINTTEQIYVPDYTPTFIPVFMVEDKGGVVEDLVLPDDKLVIPEGDPEPLEPDDREDEPNVVGLIIPEGEPEPIETEPLAPEPKPIEEDSIIPEGEPEPLDINSELIIPEMEPEKIKE